MSERNITKYQNDTNFIDVRRDLPGLTFFQTLFLTLCVVTSIILFTTAVYYVVRKKSLDELRHRLVPLYHFDPTECEDWEDELLDEPGKEKVKNTIQFYRSMSLPTMTTEH